MALLLETLKAATAATRRRARVSEDMGRLYAAEASYETLFSVFAFVLTEDGEISTGWERTARLLARLDQPLPIDALGATPLERLEARAATLLDVAEITTIDTLEQLQEAIRAAIAIGAPRYNGGDIPGCCTKYWATMTSLVSAPVFRGIPGHARALAPMKAVLDTPAPGRTLTPEGIDEFAWTLRRAFDAALKITG